MDLISHLISMPRGCGSWETMDSTIFHVQIGLSKNSNLHKDCFLRARDDIFVKIKERILYKSKLR
jgi:hypothetical protein